MEMVYEKVKLFRKQMEILIPEGFKDMPDYVARKKYPSKHRPPVILMDKNNMVNFTLRERNFHPEIYGAPGKPYGMWQYLLSVVSRSHPYTCR